jgi:membrane protein
VYGAFASIPIFLLWIYLSWLTVLLGALITSSLSYWRGNPVKKMTTAAKLYYALRILRAMSESMRSGTVQTVAALSKRLHIGFDTLEQILEELARAKVVRKLASLGWAMIRDAEHIKVSELYRLFVFDPSSVAVKQDDKEIQKWFEQMELQLAGTSALTLHDLFNPINPSGHPS